MPLTAKELAGGRSITSLLRPEATAADVARLCGEAREHGFHAVCVHGSRVVQAASAGRHCGEGLGGGGLSVWGDGRRCQAVLRLRRWWTSGAQELDAVLNVGRLRDGDDRYVFRELRDLVEAADGVP